MDRETRTKGSSVLGMMQVVLIVLKLCKLIDISWGLVFIPTYITLGIVLIILMVYIIALFFATR